MTDIMMEQAEILALARRRGLFSWSPRHREHLASLMSCRAYPAEAMVYEQGAPTREAYVLLKGKAKLVLHNGTGREIALRVRGELGAFGSFSAIDGRPREATLVTLTPCVFGIISAEAYNEFLELAPDFARELMTRLIHEIRFLYQRLYDFNQYTIRQRLALEILRQAHRWMNEGKPLDSYRLPPQATLAALIDTSREAVSREIRPLHETGALRRVGRKAGIADLDKLTEGAALLDPAEAEGFSQYFPFG
jgi:CRP/FNR family cyclic AMP-dependent transcriptional regulator